MSFLKIKDPRERERVVKEFLEIKKNIRANELAEKTGKIEFREGLSEIFKPATEAQKTTAREITEGLRPIKEGIEQLPERMPKQKSYISSLPYAYEPSTTEEEEEEEEEDEQEVFPDSDTAFGFYKKDGKTFLGDKLVYIGRNDFIIGSKRYEKTPGLKQLLLSKNPKEGFFTDNDLRTYEEILLYTNAMHRDNNPKSAYPKASRSLKWKNIVKPIWDKFKGKKTGKGVKKVVIPCDPNALLKRLDLLMASKATGHTGLRNELVSVCDELKRQGIFDNKSYKRIMSLL